MKSKDQILLEKAYQSILDGLSKGKSLEYIAKKHNVDINELSKELDKGIEVELEHTKNNDAAKQIAMDHLFEDPNYYTKLKTIERK